MGPFLASRVPTGAALWLFGVAAFASVISLATLPDDDVTDAPIRSSVPPIWNHQGCRPARAATPQPTVFVGPMTDSGAHRTVLQETTRATIATHRPSWNVQITDAPLTITSPGGFYIEGTVEDLDTQRQATRSTISCKVTFWIAAKGGKRFSVASGSASVRTSPNHRDVELSREACVESVVEDIVERQLIRSIEHPTLDDFSGPDDTDR